jgi:hypothetical protein
MASADFFGFVCLRPSNGIIAAWVAPKTSPVKNVVFHPMQPLHLHSCLGLPSDPPSLVRPCLWLAVQVCFLPPASQPATDFHRLDNTHAGQTEKQAGFFIWRSYCLIFLVIC